MGTHYISPPDDDLLQQQDEVLIGTQSDAANDLHQTFNDDDDRRTFNNLSYVAIPVRQDGSRHLLGANE